MIKAKFILVALGLFCSVSFATTSTDACNMDAVKAELDELNRGLPYMLDEHTSLTATTCKDNTLTYDYLIKDGDTMKFSKMPEASLKFLKDAMPTSMLNDKLCREIKTFTTHLKNVRYNFRLENGELLSTAIEPLSRCQK